MNLKDLPDMTAAYQAVQEKAKKLDPVGKEDGDVDNDGDKDSSDKYLMKRRKAISKAMKEHHQKDEDGNVIEHEDEADGTPSSVEEATKGEKLDIKTTGVKNKIEINPEMKTEARDRLLEKMSQASKNVGTTQCWTGYKRAGTQMKKGKVVPKCEKESLMDKVETDALKLFNAK